MKTSFTRPTRFERGFPAYDGSPLSPVFCLDTRSPHLVACAPMSRRGLARGRDVRLCRDLHVFRECDIQVRILGERSGMLRRCRAVLEGADR